MSDSIRQNLKNNFVLKEIAVSDELLMSLKFYQK